MAKTLVLALPVLLVDDDEAALFSASVALNSEGIDHVVRCQDSRDVMSTLSKGDFAVIVLDMLMPHLSGWDLLPMIRRDFPKIPVIIVTAVDEVASAVECMKKGTFDYLIKPVESARLAGTVRRAIDFWELREENTRLRRYLLSDTLQHPEAFADIITQNPRMGSIFKYIEAIASTSMPVLITGETGVGKELTGRVIHQLSGRTGEFISVNVAGLDDQLFSDTLFGHQKEAFTGADRGRAGLIERAQGGTLVLDEIGDLSIESQVKLLHLLEQGEYYPLGADLPKSTDARIIAATNQEIRSLTEAGQFRKDLFYRLQTHHIHLPPLRERRDDIPFLVEHCLKKAAEMQDKEKPKAPKALFTLLDAYHFPGNIRELESMVFDAVSTHQSPIDRDFRSGSTAVLSIESFVDKIGSNPPNVPPIEISEADTPDHVLFSEQVSAFDPLPPLKEAEQLLIDEALKRAKGNQAMAARLLGMSRQALHNRLRRGGQSTGD